MDLQSSVLSVHWAIGEVFLLGHFLQETSPVAIVKGHVSLIPIYLNLGLSQVTLITRFEILKASDQGRSPRSSDFL